MSEPIHYLIDESSFDLAQLPVTAREVGSSAFRAQVRVFFERQYREMLGETTVTFENGKINVTWMPESASQNPDAAIVSLLENGRYNEVIPLLKTALQANPKDQQALYNLGMVYSDLGRLPEALELLRRATVLQPDNTNSWVALGVAAMRSKDMKEARVALERAIEIDVKNAFALRSLGTLCLMGKEIGRALDLLRQAVALLPSDPVSNLTLGQALLEQDLGKNAAEAYSLFHRVISMSPSAEIIEKAEAGLMMIAQSNFRSEGDGRIRLDAMQYCLDALGRFVGMDQDKLVPIVMEMATLGQEGLPVNDPVKKYSLKLLPGEYSALHIVCMLHVGLKCIDPGLDSGFDIAKEYDEALKLHSE
jgi:tetratricopeptide (TPR) repeat protein